ncbi:MAG: orotidine 5'-phosphate decarboxylase [Candidatus Nezhaarchaeota archaeon]|nr:orotidine 5'-phosphate decarboxylase [Candidatus Nezhaarchaeota archaeon]
MPGFIGKVLRVDLSEGEVSVESLDVDRALDFLGGRGYAAKLLYDELKPGLDPLSPENKLVFATGPLTGTSAPTSGRFCVSSRSPLTNTVFDAQAGGSFGPALKRAGFDLIVVEGASERPVYLEVKDGGARIHEASQLWGRPTHEVEAFLREKHSASSIACIGPAGEKKVRLASIMSDFHRAAGRGGLGAVMGSKGLKAVAASGSTPITVANPHAFKREVERARQVLRGHPLTGDGLGRYGTAILVHLVNKVGAFPVRNFQSSFFPEAELVSGEFMKERIVVGKKACYACPIACARISKIDLPPFGPLKTEGPEFETIWAFGPNCGVSDIEAVAYISDLCNKLGLDTISTGSTIAFAIELYQRGLLEARDMELRWGDSELLIKLVEMIARREGLGDLLAEGSARLASTIGSGAEEIAMHVKGLELPAYDPRAAKGMALAYATSNRGGCHLRAYVVMSELFSTPRYIDPSSYEGKAELVKRMQDIYAVIDSLILCKFTSFAFFTTLNYEPSMYARLLATATGMYVDDEELLKIGERIFNLERLFNLREGFTRSDDTLPARLLKEPLPDGPSKGQVVELDRLLDEYYALRGWDYLGRPSEKKLASLGLPSPYVGPRLQVAVDERYLSDALRIAERAYRGGAQILEVGTPLIKSEGLRAVREFRKKLPGATIVADLKTMDTGWLEVELAAESGADVVCVLGVSDDYTIKDAVGAARKYGVKVMCDLLNAPDPVKRAKEVEKLGVDYVCIHTGISAQVREREVDRRLEEIRKIVSTLSIPVAVAGGVRVEMVPKLVEAGCSIIIVGGAITKASDPAQATRNILKAMEEAWRKLKSGGRA